LLGPLDTVTGTTLSAAATGPGLLLEPTLSLPPPQEIIAKQSAAPSQPRSASRK
jgi:hypothetical protein